MAAVFRLHSANAGLPYEIRAVTLPEVILLSPLFVTSTTLQTYNALFAVMLPLAALQLSFAVVLLGYVLLQKNFERGLSAGALR